MPIPTNVDPIRFVAASVGIKLNEPLSLQTLRSAMLALADIVGIKRKDVQALERRALSFVRKELPQRLKNPTMALDLDVHSAAINSQVKRWVDSLDPARMREMGARLDSWIEARLVVSADDLIVAARVPGDDAGAVDDAHVITLPRPAAVLAISSRARFPSRPGPCQNLPTAGSAAAHRIAPHSVSTWPRYVAGMARK